MVCDIVAINKVVGYHQTGYWKVSSYKSPYLRNGER